MKDEKETELASVSCIDEKNTFSPIDATMNLQVPLFSLIYGLIVLTLVWSRLTKGKFIMDGPTAVGAKMIKV